MHDSLSGLASLCNQASGEEVAVRAATDLILRMLPSRLSVGTGRSAMLYSWLFPLVVEWRLQTERAHTPQVGTGRKGRTMCLMQATPFMGTI